MMKKYISLNKGRLDKDNNISEFVYWMTFYCDDCELNFTDEAAVLVTAVSSIFSAATAVKTSVTAAKADATEANTVVT